MHANPLVRQASRFAAVGVSNTLVSLLAFQLLIDAGAWATVSSALAFAVGAVNGYYWNRRWTFSAPDTTRSRLRYLLVQLCGLGMTSGLVWALDRLGIAPTASYVAAIACVTGATFIANRRFSFQPDAPVVTPSDVEKGAVGTGVTS